MKILVVEESERLRHSLASGLEAQRHAVDVAVNATEGIEFVHSYDYDLILLDLMMPRLSGLGMLRQLRAEGNGVHVMILSAMDRVEDRIRGLRAGADDYLVKPFSFDELRARVEALARRRYRAKEPELALGELVLDVTTRSVRFMEQELHLTPTEYALLELLARRRGRIFSKGQLLDQLYNCESEVSLNMIEVLISSLRKKITSAGASSPIRTRRGHGYFIE